jgi:uncharacterized membrane protein YeaQ/YmgE (transglycosylase-associated protein family)
LTVGLVISILISGLFTGALARLALPGPDPMPLWTTIAIGLAGSIAGAVIGDAISNGNGYVVSFLSLGIAIGLVAAYRRYVLKRPIWGPAARAEQLERFRGLERVRLEAMLQELHRAGVIDDDELAAKRERLAQRPLDT